MFSTILAFFANKASSIKTFAIVVVGVLILGAIGYATYSYVGLKSQNSDLKIANTQLDSKNQILTDANKQNTTVIEQQKKDAKDQETAVDNFSKKNTADMSKLNNVTHKISTYSSTDDGQISKVLKDAVNEVIESRKGRQ